MTATIPMICIAAKIGMASICFVPVGPPMDTAIDPEQDCSKVWEMLLPAFTPEAQLVKNCALIGPDCSARGKGKDRCQQPGDEWVR